LVVGFRRERRTFRANAADGVVTKPAPGGGVNPTTKEPSMSFDAFEVALQLVRALRGPIEVVARRDPALADQLRRAGASVPLNVAEGRRRAGKDRLHHYRVAAGSADEVAGALRIADAWGYLDAEAVAGTLRLCDRLLAMLWRLTH